MALISCPECGKEISDQAKQCPHCGYPISAATSASTPVANQTPSTAISEKPKKGNAGLVVGAISLLVFGLLFIFTLIPGSLSSCGSLLSSCTPSFSSSPKYSGYPSEVAKQVGTLSFEEYLKQKKSEHIIVELIVTVRTDSIGLRKGNSLFWMYDPITGDFVGTCMLNDDLTEGSMETLNITVVGTVKECNGVDELDLWYADIVSGF